MLKLDVGLSKKIGEPNYGSRGASVNLELEVEAGLINQPDELSDRIRRLFRLANAIDAGKPQRPRRQRDVTRTQ